MAEVAKNQAQLVAPGTQLGRYTIVQRLAYGGMAEIYLARASGIHGFEKYVVLKRILPQFAEQAEFVRMFLKEARVAAALDHTNIAHVYDIGRAGGSYFFTMEYLHGEDVRSMLRRLVKSGRRLPLCHAVHIAIDVAAGLHFAHDKKSADGTELGIVHRDMSPSNIVVTYDGGVKVVDFGVAKLAADPEMSRRYGLKGKLAYMSPEQIRGGAVDRRSDIFALGVVLFELITHSRLFKAATEVETIQLVLQGSVPAPSSRAPDCPPELERIILKALAADVTQRYQSARELQIDLETFARNARLPVSSAALAEWMEASFGPKREPWHALRPLSHETASSSVPNGALDPPQKSDAPLELRPRDSAATRVVDSEEDHAASDSLARSPAAPVVGDHTRPPTAPRRTGASTRTIALAVATVALVAAAASALVVHRAATADAAITGNRGRAAEQPVLVVTESGNVALEPTVSTAPTPSPAAAATTVAPAGPDSASTVSPSLPMPQKPVSSPPRAGRARTARATSSLAEATSNDRFSVALVKRRAEIRRCFSDLPADSRIVDTVALRFQVERDGRVAAVNVLPENIAKTPLAVCLAAVGRGTVFPTQPEPVTFRIPVTVAWTARATGNAAAAISKNGH